jgi:hypothetical protein
MSECRRRERERERWRPGNRAAGVLSGRKGRRDPRFVALEFVREKKAMVRNGECGAEQRDEGLTSRGVAWICKLISARPMLMDAGQSVEQMSFVAADSSRRIESLASPGRSCDRHDLWQPGSQLYARLLLLDIAVLMREIPGLAARRDDIRLSEPPGRCRCPHAHSP